VNTRIAISAVFATSLLAASVAQAQTFIAIDPAAGRAAGINTNGDIILDTHITNVLSPGTLTPLGTGNEIIWPNTPGNPAPMTLGTAINDSGVTTGGMIEQGAVRAANGTITNIAGPVGIHSIALNRPQAINSAGVVAGFTNISNGTDVSFYGVPGSTLTTVGRPDGLPPFVGFTMSKAYGINDAGVMTGYFVSDFVSTEEIPGMNYTIVGKFAYLFNTNTSTWTQLGLGVGYAINASNQVAGVKFAATNASIGSSCGRATLFSSGTTTDLGTLGGNCSTALALNNAGKVVGSSQIAPGSTVTHAFLYNGSLQDLNDLIPANDPLKATTTLTEARGINGSDQIVANGYDSSNPSQIRAYILQLPLVSFQNGQPDFGEIAVGSESDTEIVRINNDSAMDFTLGAITTTGNFSQTSNCGAVLQQHGNCAITVKFAPQTGGELHGKLTVVVNGVPQIANLTGTGIMQASLSSSTSNLVAGVPFTLTWNATAGSTCVGMGNDLQSTQSGVSWADSKPASGALDLIPAGAGAHQFSVHCTSNGVSADSNQLVLDSTWPEVTATLTPSSTTVRSGSNLTMTWSSTAATSCTASGGGANDTWPGSRPTTGSVTLLESSAVSVATPLTFTLTCMSSASDKSTTVNTVVTLNPASSNGGGGSSGGGSGALGWADLLIACGVLFGALSRRWQAARA
jgi:probable HAF family extracellular repeat protein